MSRQAGRGRSALRDQSSRCFIFERSTTTASSITLCQARLWPPLRTASGKFLVAGEIDCQGDVLLLWRRARLPAAGDPPDDRPLCAGRPRTGRSPGRDQIAESGHPKLCELIFVPALSTANVRSGFESASRPLVAACVCRFRCPWGRRPCPTLVTSTGDTHAGRAQGWRTGGGRERGGKLTFVIKSAGGLFGRDQDPGPPESGRVDERWRWTKSDGIRRPPATAARVAAGFPRKNWRNGPG